MGLFVESKGGIGFNISSLLLFYYIIILIYVYE